MKNQGCIGKATLKALKIRKIVLIGRLVGYPRSVLRKTGDVLENASLCRHASPWPIATVFGLVRRSARTYGVGVFLSNWHLVSERDSLG
jgi:hypothetical protein